MSHDPLFANNPEPRCGCVLALDVSESMSGKPIDALNKGLELFLSGVKQDELASKRVELAIVTFGDSVSIAQDFASVDAIRKPNLQANGNTPMGEALETAVQMVIDRRNIYKMNYVKSYRPWIFLITDGFPTDDIDHARDLIVNGENGKKFLFFAVGVESADMDLLKTLAKHQLPLKLDGVDFPALFRWLTVSMQSVSRQNPDGEIDLPPVTWAKVQR